MVRQVIAGVLVFGSVGGVLGLTGCASTHKAGWEGIDYAEAAKVPREKGLENLREAQELWKKRDDRGSLEQALKKLETFAAIHPDHQEALTLLARGYYLLADGHEEQVPEKLKLWETGAAWGDRALACNEGFRAKVVEQKLPVEEALDTLKGSDVAPLYWSAVNLGKWAKTTGFTTGVKYRGKIVAMVTKVQELDSKFFHGAAPRYFGTYYASIPSFAGGSLEKSIEAYNKSLAAEKNYFATHVLLAENYATKKGDRELFLKHLRFVVENKPESLPDVAPEQRLEQRKAKKLLAEVDERFQ